MQDIFAEVEILSKEAENPMEFSKKSENATKVNDLARRIDTLLNDPQIEKNDRAKLLYQKSRILNFLDTYSKDAEDALTKSLKLNPGEVSTWNILGNVLWKKKDYQAARKTLEGAIEQFGQNKESLRYLSIVLRFIDDPKERISNVTKSMGYAKDAVGLDIKDGESWYVLGNAYLNNYFANSKKLSELQNALKAYNQAENNAKWDNPDLYYNRGEILMYLEEFSQAIDNFNRAHTLDESLHARDAVQKITDVNEAIQGAIDAKGKFKPKKLNLIVKTIPTILKSQPKHLGNIKFDIKCIEDCSVGTNKDTILSCKVTNVISKKGEVPARFVIVDAKANFGSVSIYHVNDEIYDQVREQTEIYLINPAVKDIKFSAQEKEFNYRSIQVFDPDSLWIDSNKVTNIFSPSEITHKSVV